MEHYRIDHSRKIIRAIIELLTDAEIEVINKYLKLGYKLKNVKEFKAPMTKAEREAAKEEAKKKPFSHESIVAFLKKQDKAHLDKYWSIFNEPSTNKDGTIRRYKKDLEKNDVLIHKAGDVIVKGHVATLRWFKETFPEYGKTEEK